MDIGSSITIKAGPSASARTKNRLRENRGLFTIMMKGNPACFDGDPCILVRSTEGWFGWFREAEIECQLAE
jgi:hypothetical protein